MRKRYTAFRNLSKSKVNLCDICKYEIPTCNAKKVTYGNSIGNDNIIKCDAYSKKSMILTPGQKKIEMIIGSIFIGIAIVIFIFSLCQLFTGVYK